MNKSTRPFSARTDAHRCITRIVIPDSHTRGWEVRVIRRGRKISEFFSDKKFGGKAGALSEAMHFRDTAVRKLKPIPRSVLAERTTARNTSGMPGVSRRTMTVHRGEKTYEYLVWTATGSPSPGQRQTRNFYVSEKCSEDDAREAAIAQRLRWLKQMKSAENETHAAKKSMPLRLTRRQYAEMFGPTVGDRVRLADTELFLEVERDYLAEAGAYGDEVKFGGGKVIRDGMGQSPTARDAESLDLVITNALILDAVQGVVKADIGVKYGRIVGIGHAGNPGIQQGITPGMVIGAATEVIAGEGCIVTAGGIDTHIHFICPQQIEHALASGVTTMIGGGTGPAHGTYATTCTPGKWNIHRMLEAADEYPMNLGFLGKGNCATHEPLREQVLAGVVGLKLHEDWGTTPGAISTCLDVADELDVQVAIHTDTLNEAGFVEDTIKAFKGRTIHTFHSEGAGGGHAPDIIKVCGEANVLPASTNPTRPFTINTIDEHLDMLMVCHHLDSKIPEDVAFAESRIRPETIAAEDLLHDLGAFSIMSSDSQAMGRVGEVVIRTWQTAHKMKVQFGRLEPDFLPRSHEATQGEGRPENMRGNSSPLRGFVASWSKFPADNFRALRYIAKYTINPAIAHGIAHEVGSIEVGKLADLVVWKPAFFGVKPEVILKGGLIAMANMGDPGASIPTPQPMFYRPQFAAHGRAKFATSVTFVSGVALQHGLLSELHLAKRLVAVKNTRKISKRDLLWNDALPKMEVDPETYTVKADGRILTCEPASVLPMAQRYSLF